MQRPVVKYVTLDQIKSENPFENDTPLTVVTGHSPDWTMSLASRGS